MALAALTERQFSALPRPDQAEYLSLQEDLVGGESLHDFIVRTTPHQPPPRHFAPLIHEIEKSRLIRRRKVCFSMPPRHGKTILLLRAFAWWLSKFPADTNAYYSYNGQQGCSKSVVARDIAQRAGVRLSEEVNNKAEWRTTDGGGLLAGGVGTGLTGQGVSGLVVVDDPFKNPMDAYSQDKRDAVYDWFRTVPMTRREGATVFVIHTRWHEDDLIGRLAKKGGWTIVNLPAVAEENDPLGRTIGDPLWPEKFPLEDLEETKIEVGEFDFAALYQGRPRPRGGSVFGEPRYYDPATVDLTGCRIVLAADPAASERTSADYSAAVVLALKGEGPDARAYVLHVYRKQVAIPQFVQDLIGLQQRFGNTAINVESVGGFKAIPQMLRALGLTRIREIIPEGDKFTRAQRSAASWNAGRLLVPCDSPAWLGAFLDELAKFTGVNDKHDDQVDALAHAFNTDQDRPTMFDVL